MNPILLDYCKRFQKEPNTQIETFFTNYTIENYRENLPYLYDIENFCLRLFDALKNQERVCIYADYDTDAVTATGVMYQALKDFGFQNLSFYAPDRFVEGYGMNPEATVKLAMQSDLIISVDCGINSVLEAQAIKELSCDLIITDHHHLQADLPDCLGVINCRLAQKHDRKNYDCPKYISQNISETWQKNWKNDLKKNTNFVTSSVTGVGVAWFCVVWFGYFLEDVKKSTKG